MLQRNHPGKKQKPLRICKTTHQVQRDANRYTLLTGLASEVRDQDRYSLVPLKFRQEILCLALGVPRDVCCANFCTTYDKVLISR